MVWGVKSALGVCLTVSGTRYPLASILNSRRSQLTASADSLVRSRINALPFGVEPPAPALTTVCVNPSRVDANVGSVNDLLVSPVQFEIQLRRVASST